MMMLNRRMAESYGAVRAETGVAQADPIQLTQMLFDGFIESVDTAEGHMRAKDIQQKLKYMARASKILVGLMDTLDLTKGGDLAKNLLELYKYLNKRLLLSNLHNDLEALKEVRHLMNEVRMAWTLVPVKLQEQRRPRVYS
ncbi:MAG: flagellar export chaperone FliS [Betaproteobacteria bacterium]